VPADLVAVVKNHVNWGDGAYPQEYIIILGKLKGIKTIILPVVLYEYETWSLTLTEEHRMRVC
jgi:hypothetical protein